MFIGKIEGRGQGDTLYYIDDISDFPYSYRRESNAKATYFNNLIGYIVDDYEFYVRIPKDYKKASFYIDDDEEPTIILFNVKKGYEPIFLPLPFKTVWAIMDDDVFEKIIFYKR